MLMKKKNFTLVYLIETKPLCLFIMIISISIKRNNYYRLDKKNRVKQFSQMKSNHTNVRVYDTVIVSFQNSGKLTQTHTHTEYQQTDKKNKERKLIEPNTKSFYFLLNFIYSDIMFVAMRRGKEGGEKDCH